MKFRNDYKNSEICELFEITIKNLKYFEETLNFLNSTIKKTLDEIYGNFEKDYSDIVHTIPGKTYSYEDVKSGVKEDNIPWDEVENEINFLYGDIFNTHENMNKIILEAIIVKLNAIIEKFFINLSWLIYEGINEKNTKILPPDYQQNKHFTDLIKAVDRINEYTNINIKNSNYWEKIKLMRELRNRFAHGNSIFTLKNTELITFKKVFGDNLIIKLSEKEDINECMISNDFTAIIEFNKEMIKFFEDYTSNFCDDLELKF